VIVVPMNFLNFFCSLPVLLLKLELLKQQYIWHCKCKTCSIFVDVGNYVDIDYIMRNNTRQDVCTMKWRMLSARRRTVIITDVVLVSAC